MPRLDDMPEYWQDLGIRFTGKNKGDLRGVRFEDINGDVSTRMSIEEYSREKTS